MEKILLTGASGYIGSQLLPVLLEKGHHIVILVRDAKRFSPPPHIKEQITVIEGDLQRPDSLTSIPKDIEVAYYLVHAMATSVSQFQRLEKEQAENFVQAVKQTSLRQIIFLGGLIHGEKLSHHLASRLQVETILKSTKIPYTILRAAIIIGANSASFTIVRDLVEKLPIMIAPRWVKSYCQPISIVDVIAFLVGVIGNPKCLNQVFEIGGPERLTYKEMLYRYARAHRLKRCILTVPVLSPRVSSYWLYFITSTNFFLARALVDSLKNDSICHDLRILDVIPRQCLTYEQSMKEIDLISSSRK